MSKYKDKKPSMIEFTRKYAITIRLVKISSFMPSILTVTTAKNVAAPLQKDFYTQSCIYLLKMWSSVMSVCRNNLSGL